MKLLTLCNFAWDPEWAPRLRSINPYWGCPFACSYCWSRAMAHRFKREPPGGWRDVQVAPLFERCSLGELVHEAIFLPVSTILIGATCDPYPPLEKSAQRTQAVLQGLQTANLLRAAKVIIPQNHKVLVLTKSPIVCRDWELLRDMGAWVGFSITAPAGVDTREWEPNAFSNASRIAALKFLHGKGVKTFSSIEPWLLLRDPWESIRSHPSQWRWVGDYPYLDITQPWRIIEETRPWVDYYIVGSWNRAGKPIPSLVPYYREALPRVLKLLEATGKAFWIKSELRRLANA